MSSPIRKGGEGSYSEFQVANRGTSPDMTAVFHAWPYGWFKVIQSNLRRKKLHIKNQYFNSLGGFFSNRDNVRAPIQFRRESQPSMLKDNFSSWTNPSIFTSIVLLVITPVKRYQLSFSELKSTTHILHQSTVSCRSDSNSTCCYR